jgi:hypothetical protein
MVRSEDKAWLSSHALSQYAGAYAQRQWFFGQVSGLRFSARLANPGGGRIIKIGNAALFTRKRRESSLGFHECANP